MLADGREISALLEGFPRLRDATSAQRSQHTDAQSLIENNWT